MMSTDRRVLLQLPTKLFYLIILPPNETPAVILFAVAGAFINNKKNTYLAIK